MFNDGQFYHVIAYEKVKAWVILYMMQADGLKRAKHAA